jgi:ADP-ribosylation factor-like protein 8
MVNIFTTFFQWLQGLFFSKELEITLVGLQNAGP